MIDSRWGSGTTAFDKAVENRLRRVAERQGLTLRKNRRRDKRAVDYGVWYLERGEQCVRESRDLKDIAKYLNEDI